jgi:ubiquinone/menaquinone biosynthesis C-methylase UbiE
VERAGHLDTWLRRRLQNPGNILGPHLREGMTVLDVGCGPGFFSIEAARLVGEEGRVIAADLQQGMLDKLKEKIAGTALEPRIALHRCENDRIGAKGPVDFILAFYVVHELPDQAAFYREAASLLAADGSMLVVEPPFHVSRKKFMASLALAREAGFEPGPGPRLLFCKTARLTRTGGTDPADPERTR